VGDARRQALNRLAVVAPEWLQAHSRAEWLARGGRRAEDDRLPTHERQRRAYVHTVGLHGDTLLDAIDAADTPAWSRDVPAVKALRHIWVQPYYRSPEGTRWRTATEGIPPSARMISSPHDLETRYAKQDTTSWIGDKVHCTESCKADTPHLMTHVGTTAGPVADGAVTTVIHAALQAKQLLPRRHIVDTGYLNAEWPVSTPRAYGVELLGPTRPDDPWQAQASQGFDASSFVIDWAHRQAVCPTGQRSSRGSPVLDGRHNAVIKIKFPQRACQACPSHLACTRATRRTITVRPHAQHLSLQVTGAGVGGGPPPYNAILVEPHRKVFEQIFPGQIDFDEMKSVYYRLVRSVISPSVIPLEILATDFYWVQYASLLLYKFLQPVMDDGNGQTSVGADRATLPADVRSAWNRGISLLSGRPRGFLAF
jgi:transposase